MGDTAVYAYCIVKSPTRPPLSRAPRGLPGSGPVSAVPLGPSLWLIAADVPLATYGPGQLDATLRDLDWVGRIAVAHEAVVEHCMRLRGATVVPMKLFTMFSSRERAVADSRSRRPEIDGAIRRIAGCEEWGVRIARSAAARRTPAAAPAATTGTGFLAAKRRARDEARQAARDASDVAAEAFDALSAVARDARKRGDVPESATAPPLLEAAFLVPVRRRARFKAAARRAAADCARRGMEMTLSGPWPAYNFIQESAT